MAKPHRYEEVLDKLYSYLTPGEDTATSVAEIAAEINESVPAVSLVLRAMRDLDFARLRRVVENSTGKNGLRGRSYWMISGSPSAVREQMKAQHKDWADYRYASGGRKAVQTKRAIVAERKEALTPKRLSAFDEAANTIARLREYREKSTFIAEQQKLFEERGIKVTFEFEQDPELDALSAVMPYVEKLEQDNERLSTKLKNIPRSTQELRDVTAELDVLRNRAAKLVAEKQDVVDASFELRQEFDAERSRLKRRIAQLEEQLSITRQKNNGAEGTAHA
jgi:hypothetical protein